MRRPRQATRICHHQAKRRTFCAPISHLVILIYAAPLARAHSATFNWFAIDATARPTHSRPSANSRSFNLANRSISCQRSAPWHSSIIRSSSVCMQRSRIATISTFCLSHRLAVSCSLCFAPRLSSMSPPLVSTLLVLVGRDFSLSLRFFPSSASHSHITVQSSLLSTCTIRASCIVISSQRTCCLIRRAISRSPTLALPSVLVTRELSLCAVRLIISLLRLSQVKVTPRVSIGGPWVCSSTSLSWFPLFPWSTI